MSFYPSEKSKGLNGLNDTSIVTPKEYDILMHNGTEWENSDVLKEQEVVPSGNLLPNDAVVVDHYVTNKGVDFIPTDDGSITVNGTATADNYYKVCFSFYVPVTGTYKLLGTPVDATGRRELYIYPTSTAVAVMADYDGTGATATLYADTEYGASIYVKNGVTLNNVVYKPMLTADLTATYDDYEPYWKALKDAMWSKDQQKVNGAYNLCSNEKLKTQVVNSTLTVTFNPSGYPKGSVRLQGYVSTGQWIGVNYRTMKLKYGQKYKLCGVKGGHSSTYRLRYYDTAGGVATVYDDDDSTSIHEFICYNPDTAQVDIYVNTGATSSNPIDTVIYPMVTTDLTATYKDYVPYAKTNSELTEDTIVKNIAPSNLSSANARISLESSDSIIIRKIGRLVVIEKLGILISAGADLPYNVGVLITGLPAPDSDKCVLVATGNSQTGFKSVGFTVNANGSLIPASFNNIPANANNQAAYFIGGASYIAKE